jgi:hypothetical protein
MKKIITFILLISLPNLSYATDFGSFSCGQIIDFGRDNNKAQMYAISLWFGGYIEGRNIETGENKFILADPEALYALLEKECREKPDFNSFFVAGRIYNRGY